MTPEPAFDLELIRDTIADLDFNLAQIDLQIVHLQAKRADVVARRDKWTKQLSLLDGSRADSTRQRAPKGENHAKVMTFLKKQPRNDGLTIARIAEGAQIGASSVRSVLRQNQNDFECVGNSRWAIRASWEDDNTSPF